MRWDLLGEWPLGQEALSCVTDDNSDTSKRLPNTHQGR